MDTPTAFPGHANAAKLAAQLAALVDSAGIAPLDRIGWIRVTGEDRFRWLNGMVTNSIPELHAGQGNYSFVLNAQGRIQGDLWAFLSTDGSLELATAQDRVQSLIALFDRFIIMDDVELADVSPGRRGVELIGPKAAEILSQIGLPVPDPVSRLSAIWRGATVAVIAAYSPVVPRFELWADARTRDALVAALLPEAARVDAEAVEWLRMLEGTPRYGIDIRDRELPQETGQGRALHFAKGCYLGQEIVERIRSRGNVHRGFAGFRLDGPLPAPGVALEADGKTVGELTSVAAIPLAGGTLQIGLGYVRREAAERSATIEYASEAGPGLATQIALPVWPTRIAGGGSGD